MRLMSKNINHLDALLVQVTIKLWIKLPSYLLSIDIRKLRRNVFYRNNVS